MAVPGPCESALALERRLLGYEISINLASAGGNAILLAIA
jgi:delta 1-pyrroline-5-carboxylate dehydrogenase